MTPQQLERAIRAFIAFGTGLDLERVRQQNKPFDRPKTLYVTVLSSFNRRQGYPNYYQGDATEGVAVITPREAEFSVQFYRDGAYFAAVEFAEWCESQIGLDQAVSRGFAIDWDSIPENAIPVSRLDEPLSDRIEERAQFDLPIIYNSLRIEHPDRIENVTGDVVFTDGSGLQEHEIDGTSAP